MLTRFDTKSNRVKGLSFHPERPWILASLHNGAIRMYDYRMGTTIDTFEEHDGPVRGVDFHLKQPLFVSGGDDCKVKVWNYKLRRCLFTLLGHLDYIRTVEFHPEYPWIVSASDDQTIRIWNWQARSCISVLTGHNHYVMSASFHPTDDLVVSASLDATVRVWDTSGLRSKRVRGAGAGAGDLFSNDATVKYVLEGHRKGVNWACFHPKSNQIASGDDDRTIRIWRYNDTRAWEVDTLRGHQNNVSCVVFHPHHDVLVSNSEDKSIRVWDGQKRVALQTYKRDTDRFWVLAAHPNSSLLAAGHDSGMVVFKLARERPAYTSIRGTLYYIHDFYLRSRVIGGGASADQAILPYRRAASVFAPNVLARSLFANHFDRTQDKLLAWSKEDGGMYTMYNLVDRNQRRGRGLAVAFLSRTRFVVLDTNKQLAIKDLDNNTTKRVPPPFQGATQIWGTSTAGRILVKQDDRLCLFETQSRRVIAQISGIRARYVVWSADGSRCAILGRAAIVVTDAELNVLCNEAELAGRVKSGVFDENNVLIYTTISHAKYLIPPDSPPAKAGAAAAAGGAASDPSGGGGVRGTASTGVLCSLDSVLYAVHAATGGSLCCMNREGKPVSVQFDPTEYLFKQALRRKQYQEVVSLIRSGSMCGQAVIAYLQRSGFPDVALHFVEDPSTRFTLALECGNLEAAQESAAAVDSREVWLRLAAAAIRAGQTKLGEEALGKAEAWHKLALLYTATGQRDKLRRLRERAVERRDVMSRFQLSLLLGDVPDRVRVLESAGQLALAYALAATHGLDEDVERLAGVLEEAGVPAPALPLRSHAAGARVRTAADRQQAAAAAAAAGAGGDDEVDAAAAAAAAAAVGDEGHEAGVSVEVEGEAAPVESFALLPPTPLHPTAESWPQLQARRRLFDEALLGPAPGTEAQAAAAAGTGLAAAAAAAAAAGGGGGAAWGGDDDDLDALDGDGEEAAAPAAASGANAWMGDDDELDLGDVALPGAGVAEAGAAGTGAGAAAVPLAGRSLAVEWAEQSSVPGEVAAAGAFEGAMKLLHRQLGIVNFAPLRSTFLANHAASRYAAPTLPSLPPIAGLLSKPSAGQDLLPRPVVLVTAEQLVQAMGDIYVSFQSGKFDAVAASCDRLFAQAPLAVCKSRKEAEEVKQMLESAREYKLAVSMEAQRRSLNPATDTVRVLELASYLTHCNLLPKHQLLTLNSGVTVAYKTKNFITAAGFARRILENPASAAPEFAKMQLKARKVLAAAEKQARNANQLDYDERNPFTICAASFTPIYRGSASITSPYSGATYKPEFAGQVCRVDGMSKIGEQTLGIVLFAPPMKRGAQPTGMAAAAAAQAAAGGDDDVDDILGDEDGW